MTKTVCDRCGKEMIISMLSEPFRNFNFCLTKYGVVLDLCDECRNDFNRWMKEKTLKEGD